MLQLGRLETLSPGMFEETNSEETTSESEEDETTEQSSSSDNTTQPNSAESSGKRARDTSTNEVDTNKRTRKNDNNVEGIPQTGTATGEHEDTNALVAAMLSTESRGRTEEMIAQKSREFGRRVADILNREFKAGFDEVIKLANFGGSSGCVKKANIKKP